jgi:hypothetical protein
LDAEKMMNTFKSEAVCLGRALGCVIEICADGTVSCSCSVSQNGSPIIEDPFIVASKIRRCGPIYGRRGRKGRNIW